MDYNEKYQHDLTIKEVIYFLKEESKETLYMQKHLKIEKMLEKLSKFYEV